MLEIRTQNSFNTFANTENHFLIVENNSEENLEYTLPNNYNALSIFKGSIVLNNKEYDKNSRPLYFADYGVETIDVNTNTRVHVLLSKPAE